ncbi:retrovirus-related pol polyprotein from transposon TNT 1-94 [Tanacetum coccineum]
MTRQRLHTDFEVCMYALTVSTIEPKNIKEAMQDHTFLNGPLNEEVYVSQPEGFIDPEFPDHVYRLKNLYTVLSKHLVHVQQSPHGIFRSQSQYAIELLKKHGLDKCVSMSTPMAAKRLDAELQGTPTNQMTYRHMIGGLMYLTTSHPDIAFATFDSGFELIAYSDADHAGCKDDYKSTSGGLQFLDRKLVSWSSIKQDCNAMSTAEAEYSVIIMAQQQHVAEVHPDELCPPNKRYDLMDANKKVDLEHVQCPPESKILTCIIKNHPLRFSIAASSSVPWIYMPPLQIMQLMYCFVNNIHVDYVELLWEGLYYFLHHSTSSIPYPRFTKIIVSHYMTIFPEISRRARDMYHNLQDDDIMKNIFILRKHKDKVGMQIPDWMITEEMKHTEHYRMYAEVFGLDVPLTQSEPTESTQGTHRTPSAPRSPNPKMDEAESSSPKRSTVIRFRLPERRYTCLTPPAPVPTVDKADEIILQDTLQISLTEHKSQEEQEARENVELVNKHLASEEIEKMMEGSENVIDDSLPPRNDEPNIHGIRLEPRSDKESPDVEITIDEEVEITNVVIPVNLNEEEEEITDEEYELKRMGEREDCRGGRYTYLFERLNVRFLSRKSFDTLADHLQEVMVESLPTMVDTHIKEQVKKQVLEQVRDQVPVYIAEGLILERQKTKEEMERMIAKAILQERGNIQAEISSQI